MSGEGSGGGKGGAQSDFRELSDSRAIALAQAVDLLGVLLAANNLSDLASAPTARTSLGLGTAATHAVGDFDAAGAAAAAQTAATTAAATDATTKANAAQAAAISAGKAPTTDVTFNANTHGPVIVDQSDGHTYRIVSTAGVLSTVQVS